jgi:hypothetical protein
MQCTNCQFQNMPGSAVCGRCGTSLTLTTVLLDVHPPRAGAWRKRLRNAVPVARAYHRVAGAIADAPRFRNAIPGFASASQLLRSIVPGWAHFHLRLRWLGHAFLWGFLALFIPGLLHFGSRTGSILLGLAFSVHSTAALDIVMRAFGAANFRDRMARSIAVTLVLALVLYYPAGWMLTRILEPHTIERPFGPFRAGDVVFVNQWAAIQPGKMVLYTPNEVRERTNPGGGHTQYFTLFAGPRIDRVLAAAGDTVRWDAGKLFVNGIASAVQPLDPSTLPVRLALTVPDGQVLILPSGGPDVPRRDDLEAWTELGLVPRGNVAGCVYLRTQPFTRFAWIH